MELFLHLYIQYLSQCITHSGSQYILTAWMDKEGHIRPLITEGPLVIPWPLNELWAQAWSQHLSNLKKHTWPWWFTLPLPHSSFKSSSIHTTVCVCVCVRGKERDIYIYFLKFYWSIVDLQCCVSFRCTAKWFSSTYTYVHSFSDSFLI